MQYISNTLKISKIVEILKNNDLFQNSLHLSELLELNNLQTDSRLIKSNDIFVCIKGYEMDGHNFAELAMKKGATLLISEKTIKDYPQIIVYNSRKAVAILAKYKFENPSGKFKLIGITGTNGKTTTLKILENLLKTNKSKVGTIGTLGYSIVEKYFSLNHTTPDIIELNKILSEMVRNNIEYVIIEVSSHALALERVFGLEFDAAIFTNLSQDHLDFHNTMETYAKEKFKLLQYTDVNNGFSVINIDDKFGKDFYNSITNNKISYSINESDYQIQNVKTTQDFSSFLIKTVLKSFNFKINLIGKFNIYNYTAAFCTFMKLVPQNIVSYSDIDYSVVPGRLEKLNNTKDFSIFIDFAHTPDALENVLQTLSETKKNKLYCVFGAGGNRDKTKRPQMMTASLKFADYTIVTSDNPRTENPSDIISDIIEKSALYDDFWIISDRKKAIETAISLLRKDDILLLAGKGHENYQIIGNDKIPFDEKEIVYSVLEKQKSLNNSNSLSIPIDIIQLEHFFGQKVEKKDNLIINHISTDSRDISQNSLFFALSGENFDGHNYVEKILEKKNCYAVVNKDFKSNSKKIFRVKDPLIAYGNFAKNYRNLFPALSIALTGSYGKTTTKEYIYNILNSVASTLRTFENENNSIGLPKTIFKLKPKYDYAIYELGSNHFGEISYLRDICEPDISIITNIGASHLEFLIDENGVYKEKSTLFRKYSEIKIFPRDDKRFEEFSGITFGYSASNNYHISDVFTKNDSTFFKVNNLDFQIASPFKVFVLNATISILLAKELHIDEEIIKLALQKDLDMNLRMEIVKNANHIFLADCYNANPNSMEAAIEFWKNYKPQLPHYAILGDMLELGELAQNYHKEVSDKLKEIDSESIISIGNHSKLYQSNIHFDKVEDFMSSGIVSSFKNNSVILLKASHGIHLEKILA
ncbi:MAG: UDP-N-acetylmuramoyl-L-alanyl-D-glutamate--2,6-diaminopimelate ligase [Candidatus Cloacimonetes bacterium]|nr:UDP-N-acetylmuramoyl-L-alanyl-D-glutamate--2,6-diaminopimelate ligase [Candidatus Cloacimonadota bacterium]